MDVSPKLNRSVSILILLVPKTEFTIAVSSCSSDVVGLIERLLSLAISGAGNSFKSILPLVVIGKDSTNDQTAGII